MAEVLEDNLVTLAPNQPLVLDDPDVVWIVRSGTLAVFCAKMDGDIFVGRRRLLFRAFPGQALFGAHPYLQRCLLCTSGDSVKLERRSLGQVTEQLEMCRPEASHEMIGWVHHVTAYLSHETELPAKPIQLETYQNLHVEPGQVVCGDPHICTWMELKSGQGYIMGMECLPVTVEDGLVALSAEMWIQFDQEADIVTHSMFDFGGHNALQRGLLNLHSCACTYVKWLRDQEWNEERDRLKRQHLHQWNLTGDAFQSMESLLNPSDGIVACETPLLTAVSTIGEELGIEIRPPAKSEDMRLVNETLDAIAHASKFRTRLVLLQGRWWEQDCGPLLGYLDKQHRLPIALLRSGDSYDVIDPISGTRSELDADILEQMEPHAHMIYVPLPDDTDSLWDLMAFAIKRHKKDAAYITLMGLGVTLLSFITPLATHVLMDEAIPQANGRQLFYLVVALLGAALGTAAFSIAQGFAMVRVQTRADTMTQAALWDRLLRLKSSFFRGFSSGDLMSRVTAIHQISNELNTVVIRSFIGGILSLLNLILMFYYCPPLAWMGILIAIFIMLATLSAGRMMRTRIQAMQEFRGRFNGLVIQMIGGIAKLKIAGAEHRAFNTWIKNYKTSMELQLRIQVVEDAIVVFNRMIPTVSSILLFWIGGETIMSALEAPDVTATSSSATAVLTVGTFLAFYVAYGQFIRGISEVSDTMVRFLDTMMLSRRIIPILEAPREVPPDAVDPGRLSGNLALEHVTFRYTEDGPMILNDVSIHADPGEFIALVGPSGSGKSTILRLLLAFEEPEVGRVLYDGQNLSGADIEAIRRQIGVVLQNGRLNAGAIHENIRGNHAVSMDQVWEAARDAGFAEDVEAMPMGMHTIISEGGTNLSGGQRQRLLIARALLTRPKIIFFDEATSALDNKTQATVSEALERRKATRVVVAHRLSTIMHADRIYVLADGKVCQVGTYAELADQDGVFKELVSRQKG